MIFLIALAILSLLFLYIYYVLSGIKKLSVPGLKEPPLEKGLPLIGILRQVEHPLHNYFMKLGKKHGDIFRIKFGMREIVILNDFNSIRKAFKVDGHNFSGRCSDKSFLHDNGIIFKDGDVWVKQRSFISKVLRDFGFGKSNSCEVIHNECNFMLDEFYRLNGEPVDISKIIPSHTANIISQFIMNKRFNYGDPTLNVIQSLMDDTKKSKDLAHMLYMLFPAFSQLKLIAMLTHKLSSQAKIFDKIHEAFRNEIDEHLKVLNFNSEGEDFIDKFLIMQHQLKEKHESIDNFTDFHLIRISLELFMAGYETTSSTLGWSFMFLSKFPDIQDKVYKEIIQEIGTERSITMNDKKSLHYTQSVMDEILRLSSVAPLAIAHRTFNDTILDGYFIPKDTMIFPNLYACHHDPKLWEKPTQFYPEHFLTDGTDGEWKYNSRPELIPFGIGKRQCLGESLARMEYFIFFVNIIRKFSVKFAEDISESNYQEALLGNKGSIRTSSIKTFIFEQRL